MWVGLGVENIRMEFTVHKKNVFRGRGLKSYGSDGRIFRMNGLTNGG